MGTPVGTIGVLVVVGGVPGVGVSPVGEIDGVLVGPVEVFVGDGAWPPMICTEALPDVPLEPSPAALAWLRTVEPEAALLRTRT